MGQEKIQAKGVKKDARKGSRMKIQATSKGKIQLGRETGTKVFQRCSSANSVYSILFLPSSMCPRRTVLTPRWCLESGIKLPTILSEWARLSASTNPSVAAAGVLSLGQLTYNEHNC
jgi:hypothetical protein